MPTDPLNLAAAFLDGPHGRIAHRATPGAPGRAGLVWCGGFRSDMLGGKATTLHAWARDAGRPFLRFDYSGHGESDGRFEDGCVGDWLADALTVFDAVASPDAPQILVGSSMGAWIALHMARARQARVHGLLLIAPAPDFTEDLMWARFPKGVREGIEKEGVWMQPSPYGPCPITKRLIEDGRTRLLLRGPIDIPAPVRILQGMADEDVPYAHALRLVDALAHGDVHIRLIKDGDHRLSRDEDLALLKAEAAMLAAHLDRF